MGFKFFSACPLSSFKIFESLQNSAIQIALGVHKHTPLSKLKILLGLASLSERASSLRIKYFLQIQAYGTKHAVYAHTFAWKSACPSAHSSWNKFQLEVPNWNQHSPYAYPFTESSPWEMSPPGCQVELITLP